MRHVMYTNKPVPNWIFQNSFPIRVMLFLLIVTFYSVAQCVAQEATKPDPVQRPNQSPGALVPGSTPVKIPVDKYIVGADISWVQTAEDRGTKYRDHGVEKDILKILKDHGFNYIRLRVFVDPTKATPRDRPYSMQGYCDLPHTIKMLKGSKTPAWDC